MNDKQLIIIGGGTSLKEGISKGLWNTLKGKLTFGLNYSYRHFESTVQIYVDQKFYNDEHDKLAGLPLILGNNHSKLKCHPNTIMFPASSKYDPTLAKGVYKASLCGMFALSLALYFKPKEIFLLGFDYGSITKKVIDKKFETHFYQGQINHRGIGRINYYTAKGRAEKDFKPYKESGNIYNVSVESTIPTFPKISYDEFFKRLNNIEYDQNRLREEIKSHLKEVGK